MEVEASCEERLNGALRRGLRAEVQGKATVQGHVHESEGIKHILGTPCYVSQRAPIPDSVAELGLEPRPCVPSTQGQGGKQAVQHHNCPWVRQSQFQPLLMVRIES